MINVKARLGTTDIQIGKAVAHVLEVSKHENFDKSFLYIVSLYVTYENYISPRFTLVVKDEKDLIFKLRVEIAKMRTLLWEGHTKLFTPA